MNIKTLQENWNEFGKSDPLYAILTFPGKQHNRWDENDFFALGKKEIDDLMTYVDSLGIKISTHAALDFGCGVGRLTQGLGEYFAQVSGVDIAASMIEQARRYNRHGDRCNYFVNEKDDLALFPDASFDFIYSNITLQHISPEYSKKYIEEFVRILSPNGLMVFQLPAADITTAEARSTLRSKMRDWSPAILRKFYHQVRYGASIPVMQMYAVNEAEVVTLLEERGAAVVDVAQQPMGEENWRSLRYCVRKL